MSIAEKLVTVAENQQKVYEAGIADEREIFWESFQQRGNRTDYNNAFKMWGNECYNPIYPFMCTNATGMFNSCRIVDTKVPIDLTAITSSSSLSSVFAYSTALTTINKLIVNENTTYTNWFPYCNKLKNITFEGTIGQSIDFSVCPLTVESMLNVISHLKDYRYTEDEAKYAVYFSENCWKALENSGIPTNVADVDLWRDVCFCRGWRT